MERQESDRDARDRKAKEQTWLKSWGKSKGYLNESGRPTEKVGYPKVPLNGLGCPDITKIKASRDAVILDPSVNLHSMLFQHKELLENISYWHRFNISNTLGMKRNHILKTILDHVQPMDLIPVYFVKESPNTVCFLARNCELAVRKLCADNLVVENPLKKDLPFKIQIVLRFSSTQALSIDVSKNITKVLKRRSRTFDSVINLYEFHADQDLTEFCPLSQPKLLSYVLHLSKNFKPTGFDLRKNEIRNLVPIEAVWGMNITSLDLRDNLIPSLSELEPLNQLKIKYLWLEGNPLCDKYDDITYIQTIRKYCPDIKTIDGVTLLQCAATHRQNFLCNPEGAALVEEFIEYYFTSYDTNRDVLQKLYDKNAMFSLSCYYISGQISSLTAHLSTYKVHSRNLLTLADVTRSDANLKQGQNDIMQLFRVLPRTEHDPYTFKVDLIQHTDTLSMIVVSGVCRQLPENILDTERFLGFSRCFLLQIIQGEYKIINEQLHLCNALNEMQKEAFVYDTPLRPQFLPAAKTAKQKTQMVDAVKLITNMTTEWATRCLEESDYDMKKALSLFVDMYKVDKIPPDGMQT